LREPSSLLNWMKRMLRVRSSSQAFGRGTLNFLRPGNRKVLAYLREYDGDTLLCVVNLSRSAQAVELNLSAYKTRVPVELLGHTSFPPIGELPYLLTLPGHAFYWFRLSDAAAAPNWHEERLPREALPILVLFEGWDSLFGERVAPWRAGMARRVRTQVETDVLPPFLSSQRWFAAKDAALARAKFTDYCLWQVDSERWLLAFVDAETPDAAESTDGEAQRYFLPLALLWEDDEARQRNALPVALARVRQQARTGILADALADEMFCRALVGAIGGTMQIPCAPGKLRGLRTDAYDQFVDPQELAQAQIQPLTHQGSNTTARLGANLLLKIYRRVRPGISSELELGRYLTDVVQFKHCVPVAGALEYLPTDSTEPSTVALLQPFIANQGDAWHYTASYLQRFFDDHGVRTPNEAASPDAHGAYLALIDTLALRSAQLHLALATPSEDPAFAPEPLAATDIDQWIKTALSESEYSLQLLQQRWEALPEHLHALAGRVLARRAELMHRLERARPTQTEQTSLRGLKTRFHGDYHLGQVLMQRNDFIIIDFEGEPGRPNAQRRIKQSPLRDVAGMLRSFDYARHSALRQHAAAKPHDYQTLEPLARDWLRQTRERFLAIYTRTVGGSPLYGEFERQRKLLQLFELQKAFYELRYELESRPDWAGLPLAGLLELSA
jgi:maltose alpha-D-glucosyltransferase/alpha-amylase